MRKLYLIIILGVLFTHIQVYSDTGEPDTKRKTYKEITKTDITRYKNITAKEILVFGIHLGMTPDEVSESIKYNSAIFLKEDPFNENRIYLYDTNKINNKNRCIGYLKYTSEPDNSKLRLSEVVLYFDFIHYMVGNSKNLLTLEVINKNSQIVKNFIGFPATRNTELDIPSLGLKSFSYYYPDKNFKITRYISDDGSSLSFSILLPE